MYILNKPLNTSGSWWIWSSSATKNQNNHRNKDKLYGGHVSPDSKAGFWNGFPPSPSTLISSLY